MIEKGKANVIIGGQWGSEGKGKLAGWLYANHPEISVAVSDFTPNTGHTFIEDDGRSYVSKILPMGLLFETVRHVIIGPHAVIDLERFEEELSKFRRNKFTALVSIHPLASVVTMKNRADEARRLGCIASTMQGSAAAAVGKIMRNASDLDHVRFARDEYYFRGMLCDTQALMQTLLEKGHTALIETGQGFDLGLNNGWQWPYVTGRDVMLGRTLDSAGVHPKQLGSVTVALRTYPIRVGSIPEGSSGGYYPGQSELSWEAISHQLGREICEHTTITKRIRRVFTWSDVQTVRMLNIVRPDYAFLNYVNYLPPETKDADVMCILNLLAQHGCALRLLGTGPRQGEMEEIQPASED